MIRTSMRASVLFILMLFCGRAAFAQGDNPAALDQAIRGETPTDGARADKRGDENQNAGMHTLLAHLPEKTRQARIAIVIETKQGSAKPLQAEPLAEWVATAKQGGNDKALAHH